MRNNWLVQGLISNWIAALMVVAVGLVLTYLSGQGSRWVVPILSGLCGSALILLCLAVSRFLLGASPRNIENRVRHWLDRAGTATKNVELPDFLFNYHVTLNGKVFIVAQFRSHPEFIHFHSDLTYTDADNRAINSMPGGVISVVRLMRICLALKQVGHAGVEAPFKKIVLSKRLLIASDLNEEKFVNTLYTVEAALNLVIALGAPDNQLTVTPSSPRDSRLDPLVQPPSPESHP